MSAYLTHPASVSRQTRILSRNLKCQTEYLANRFAIVQLIIPGPKVAFCVAQSLAHGFSKALPVAFGIRL